MRKKSIAIWALTSITFISLVHLIEAITGIMFNNPIRLLQLYPYGSALLNSLTPYTYFYLTATTTSILWAITCLVAFNNPVESYMNKRQQTDAQIQERDELLDRMCETVESDHQTLTQMKDLILRMQGGLKEEQAPLVLKEVPSIRNMPKTAGHAVKVVTKPRRTSLFHRKPKNDKKKNEDRKNKIDAHDAMLPMRKMK